LIHFYKSYKHYLIDSMEEEAVIDVKDERRKEDSKDVPDGGWGWCVVTACFLCNMVNDGIAYSFGVILGPMQSDLHVGVGTISLVGGVLAGVTMCTGPISAGFVNRFGSRVTCIVGSLIATGAMFLSSYSNTFISLLISYGVFLGFGLGFVYVPAVVAVGEYFREKLSFATGICVCGSGAGTFLVAPMTSFLLDKFGWRGCNRLMSLLCFACMLFGLVMVPNKKKQIQAEDKNAEQAVQLKEKSGLKLLSDIPFLLMLIGNIPFAMAIYISYTYLPSMAVQSGLSSSDASFLISVVGISNTVGRLVSGWLADLKWTSPLGITILTTFIACIICACLPSGQHYWPLFGLTAVFGFIISAAPTVSTPLIVDLLGIQHLNMAFGFLTFARGIAALVGPSSAGFILDTFSSDFFLPFYIASGLYGLSGCFHLLIWCWRRSGQRRRGGYTAL